MDPKGDIPDKAEIDPEATSISPSSCAKVEIVDTILKNGGVAHVYLKSVTTTDEHGAEDIHLHDFNTHRFTDSGLIFYHADDKDVWICGDDIGVIERHYEE